MKNEGWDDISEGWGGNGCSEGWHISEGDNGLGGIEGWGGLGIDSGTQI
jgi:hypothetical protein